MPEVLLRRPGGWLAFRDPVRVLEATTLADVLPVMEEVVASVEGAGLHAAGFLAYEAAPAFDEGLVVRAPGALPLAWWALFEEPARDVPLAAAAPPALDWRSLVSRRAYTGAISRIHAAIARGDTYQVNYTFPLEAAWNGADPREWLLALHEAQFCGTQQGTQEGGYSAYVDTGRFALCSASPELFFTLDGERVVTRPMKGTARRGRDPEEDRRLAAGLAGSEKNRAENVMIVDMMRNDLGRVARPGSVRVEALFEVETYPTVHQLTSTVTARTSASVVEILRALFPPSSITGAPKRRTMELIRELEGQPRGAYTGSVGYLAPGRRASFNVAIRTATVDREDGTVRYGTGGGIVWDSEAEAEYEECRTKALVLGIGSTAGWTDTDPGEAYDRLRWRSPGRAGEEGPGVPRDTVR